jgi:hypothetical protein
MEPILELESRLESASVIGRIRGHFAEHMCCTAFLVSNGCKPCMDKLARTFTMAEWALARN